MLIPAHPFPTLLPKLDLAGRRSIIAAVSGGSDSLALLLLAKVFFQHGQTQLIAVTIDHGLRSASSAEAGKVAAFCAARNIEHRILRWSGAKPTSGLAAAAREARYRLLAQAASEAGTDLVLTGHTRDDQAETIAMRKSRGEGKGLAGMAPATLYDGRVWILRPLLANRRATLRAFLRHADIDWIDDPTNRDMAFERARIRAQGVDIDDEQSARAARERIALSQNVAALVQRYAISLAPGLVRLAPEFAADENPASLEALRLLLAIMGGAGHVVDTGRAAALFKRLGKPLRATLSRSIVDVRRTGIFLYREARGLPAPAPLRHAMVWDGRFFLSGEGGIVEPFGPQRASAMLAQTGDGSRALMHAALSARPAMRDETGELAPLALSAGIDRGLPAAAAPRATPLLSPWRQFLPSFDLAAAACLARLINAPPIPPLPIIGRTEISDGEGGQYQGVF